MNAPVTIESHLVRVEAADLLSRMTAALRTVETKSPVPILTTALMRVDKGSLEIVTTDLDQIYKARIDAEASSKFEFTVHIDRLLRILRKCDKGSLIDIELGENGNVRVQSGTLRMNFGGQLPATDFPTTDDIGGDARLGPTQFMVPVPDLQRILKKTSSCVSKEETRYYLNGVFIHVPEGQTAIAFVATDGHRLCRVNLPLEGELDEARSEGYIVPRKAIAELLNLLKKRPDTDAVHVRLSNSGAAFFFSDGQELVTKVIDGTFPDYTRVLAPVTYEGPTADPTDVSRAIRLVSLIADKKGHKVSLEANDDGVNVMCASGTDTAVQPVSASGGVGKKYCFNGDYMTSILQNIEGHVTFDAPNLTSPIAITDSEDEDALFVLMPVKK